MESLLSMDPLVRPAYKEVKQFEYFQNVNWENQLLEEPPFIPQLENPLDTCYFQGRHKLFFIMIFKFLNLFFIISSSQYFTTFERVQI